KKETIMKRSYLLAFLVVLAAVLFAEANHGSQNSPQVTSQEKNKALVRRFYDEVWKNGNLAVADEVFAANYVRHDPLGAAPAPGVEGQKQIAAAFRKAMPDRKTTIDLMIAEGDLVAARWTMNGVHVPTGKKVEFAGVNIFRIASGKIVELWNHRDDLGFQQQIGAIAPK
ncbi:MAG: ester cyclase, partial [Blastocatellia bacterium]